MTAHERGALGLAGVLWAHLPRDGYDDERDQETTYCTCGGWAGNYFAEGEAGPFDVHLVQVLLAHLADVLGSDEMREVVAERLSVREMTEYSPDAHEDHNRWSWRGDGHGEAVRDGFRAEADAVLAAVREVLGLPGGGA